MAPSRTDLEYGLLGIQHQYFNLSELKYGLELIAKANDRNERVSLAEIMQRAGYLNTSDVEHLRMLQGTSVFPEQPSLKSIETEFFKNLDRIKEGATFGRYKILKLIGRGGMGAVFKVDPGAEGEPLALKLLIGGASATVRDIERFKKEAAVQMQIRHPNIVEIHEIGREKGLDYITMEYVDGRSLREIVKDSGPIDQLDALAIIRETADALGSIHSQGIIHRDVKPDNIVLDVSGRAVLMDFGLAAFDKFEGIQYKGAIGTPLYQPPEQAEIGGRFGPITAASDVYGLGATLYWCVCGRPPFWGKSKDEVRKKVKNDPPSPPREHRPDLLDEVEGIVLTCLQKDQNERYLTPKKLIKAIDQVLEQYGRDATSHRKNTAKASKPVKLTKSGKVGKGLKAPKTAKAKSKSKGKLKAGKPKASKDGGSSGGNPKPSRKPRRAQASSNVPTGLSRDPLFISGIVVFVLTAILAIVLLQYW